MCWLECKWILYFTIGSCSEDEPTEHRSQTSRPFNEDEGRFVRQRPWDCSVLQVCVVFLYEKKIMQGSEKDCMSAKKIKSVCEGLVWCNDRHVCAINKKNPEKSNERSVSLSALVSKANGQDSGCLWKWWWGSTTLQLFGRNHLKRWVKTLSKRKMLNSDMTTQHLAVLAPKLETIRGGFSLRDVLPRHFRSFIFLQNLFQWALNKITQQLWSRSVQLFQLLSPSWLDGLLRTNFQIPVGQTDGDLLLHHIPAWKKKRADTLGKSGRKR